VLAIEGTQARADAGHGRARERNRAAHVPVLLDEVLDALAPHPDGVWLDATFGAGGYSLALLKAGAGRVVGLDRDPDAAARGRELAAGWPNFAMLEGNFGAMEAHLAALGIDRLDGLVLDLGVSSVQLDDPARGFSFAADGPLDMRMSRTGRSAADLIDHADEATLADILHRYGDERAARRIARAIVERRRREPIRGTRQLAELIASTTGGRADRIDPATRTFQALRIHVNDELGELERALLASERLLVPGGRLAVVAFHSLEDRMVKRFLAERSGRLGRPSRHRPENIPPAPAFRLLTTRPVRPTADEVAQNPRARSARLRAAERLPRTDEAP